MEHVDVVVIGGGPVGCTTALAHAKRGARVLVIEASPERRNRFAGELLHPTAVDMLRRAGVETVPGTEDHGAPCGFAVTDGAGAPVLLDYNRGHGATFEFNTFVDGMRALVEGTPGITFASGRATALDGDVLTWTPRGGAERKIVAGRIVAADGRFSQVRGWLGLGSDRTVLSHMAGLLLKGVTLPHEGYGHVMLGGPGPALAYRIGEDEVRICLDVPLPWKRAHDRERRIFEAYRPYLAPSLVEPIRRALEAGEVTWAVNEVRPRVELSHGPVALVGDAVGHFHPMTAAGMSLGFVDAVTLAEADDLVTWGAMRRRDTQVPGLLATALYEIFALDTEPTRACRRAVFRLWREKPAVRARTMDFLTCHETRFSALLGVGVQMVGLASAEVAYDAAANRRWGQGFGSVQRIGGLIHWLVNESVPSAMRIPSVTRAATPFALLREQHVAALAVEGAES